MSTPSMGDAPRQVTITANGPTAQIVVGGTDLSRSLSGYQIEHRAGQAPLVVLFARHDVDGALFDGMATVAVASETPPGDAIAEFLRAVDPVALDAAVLDRNLDGSRHELTAALLQQLAEWAQGKVT